jgi:hypothetical protein
LLFYAAAHERSRTLLSLEQAFSDQTVERLADGDSRYGKIRRQVAFGRERILRTENR